MNLQPRNRQILVALCECPRTRSKLILNQPCSTALVLEIDTTPRPVELEGWVQKGDVVFFNTPMQNLAAVRGDNDEPYLLIHESLILGVARGEKPALLDIKSASNQIVSPPAKKVEVVQSL